MTSVLSREPSAETRALTLRIDGPPRGKGRPRFNRATGHAFTPAGTLSAEQSVELAWINAGRPRLPDGPLSFEVEAVFARPGAHFRRDGSLSAAGLRSYAPTKAPDLDNVEKLCQDALNRRAFRDDALIVRKRGFKRWARPGEVEHVMVRAYWWPGE